MAGQGGTDYARQLGAELRARRVARGMSLRALATKLGLSGHATLVDYEHGRRIPPEDLITACERVFEISDGALSNLREKALAQRANHQADLLLRKPERQTAPEPEPEEQPAPRRRPRWRWLTVSVLGVLVFAAAGIWMLTGSPTTPSPESSTPVPTSRTVVASWGICWGGQAGQVQPTDAVTYTHARSLQITVTKPNSAGDFAVCTAHALESLHAGMQVSVYLRVPAAQAASGVGFFVYDSKYKPTWAPQTPNGTPVALPTNSDWQRYTWTVPTVDTVHTLGMELYSATDQPLIVWLGAVTW